MKAHKLYTILPYGHDLLTLEDPLYGFLYFKNKRLNLITNSFEKFDIQDWIETLSFKLVSHSRHLQVIHLFYELGFFFEDMLGNIEEDTPLAIDISYQALKKGVLNKNPNKIELKEISKPNFLAYKKRFDKGYSELIKGNCYQFNLTDQFIYKTIKPIDDFELISKLWQNKKNRGAYASSTYSEALEKVFLSNSPECLFQYGNSELTTMPIKGTVKLSHTSNFAKKWKELKEDKKSQAELFMITDLLRNDLCRIDRPNARVTKLKAPLLVPGLLHQYSEIKINLHDRVSLKMVLEKMFPGGSITGAPKKRVMGILHKLENGARGFYCGSTLLLTPKKAQASINIRSAVFDLKTQELTYKAGGGITLLSTARNEFLEMSYKRDSFIKLLTL